MISPSSREPWCDVFAQYKAVRDPEHPKEAMWIAAGSPLPIFARTRYSVYLPQGILFTNDREHAQWLSVEPTDATLASILGYLDTKWRTGINPVVVRALDDDGCVITEFAVAPHRAGEAYNIVKQHGIPELTTIAAAHERRRILCASEAAA
jgi:hypothetical protein